MRIFEFLFSLLLLIFLSPLLICIIIILKFSGEGEIFYLQERVGRNGTPFHIIKFATMLKDSPNMGSGTLTSKNDPRILPFGKILRKTKLNEIPQLANILIGNMSLIGPRPHAKRDLAGIDKKSFEIILNNNPGLSGIGSIVFRNEENILQKFENPRVIYDTVIAPYKAEIEVWYAINKSISVDLLLLAMTFMVVCGLDHKIVYAVFPSIPKPKDELQHLLDSKP